MKNTRKQKKKKTTNKKLNQNKNKMEKFSRIGEDKLEELAEDPNNIIYKYADREPLAPADVVPIETVRECIKKLWEEIQLVRLKINRNESTTLQQKKLVWWLKTKSPNAKQWGSFYTTHPLIFDRCVALDTTEKEIEALYYMIELKCKNNTVQGRNKFQEYILNTFSMSKKESEKKYGTDVKIIEVPTQSS
jgi:hypothetical protein